MKHDELTTMINARRPAMVDELADAAYERRPGAALVRARADASALTAGAPRGAWWPCHLAGVGRCSVRLRR